MKRIITLLAIIVILATSIKASAYSGEINRQPNIYPDTLIVDEIDRASDLVTCRTLSGQYYTFYGVEDWMVGDVAAAIMSDNGTTNTILDDIIITVRYVGYTDCL